MGRLSGKEGRMRGNICGKRVDHSSRSVITPDPQIDVDEVGVPEPVARILTRSVDVTNFNLQELTDRVRRGPTPLNGAKRVIQRNGRVVDLAFYDPARHGVLSLAPGDIVERYMQDGDYVIFNRQPTLWRLSTMAHRVRIMPGMTFRLNPVVTTPYNADGLIVRNRRPRTSVR